MKASDFILFALLTVIASAIGSSLAHAVVSVPFHLLNEVLK